MRHRRRSCRLNGRPADRGSDRGGGNGMLGDVGHGLDLLQGTTQPKFRALLTYLDGVTTAAGVQAVLTQLNRGCLQMSFST